MAGTFRSGRNRKPAELHKLLGNYKPSRHGKDALQMEDKPKKPRGLTKDEKWLWDQIMRAYEGKKVLAELDTALLLSCCQLWGLFRRAMEVIKINPTDKNSRIAAISYFQNFERVASRFGLDPAARAKLQVASGPPNDPMADLLKTIAENQNAKT
jgi:P27 family predicted phage terminase small subunit